MYKNLGNLKSIIDSVDKIFKYSKEIDSAEALYANEAIFDAILMNFIVIGESISRISPDLKENYSEIPWNEAKAMRNIVAHNYFGVDPEEVWDIIQNHLFNLEMQISGIIADLEKQN